MDSVDNKVTQGEQPPGNPPKADENSAQAGDPGKSGHDLAHDALRAARERAQARGRQPGERSRDGKYAPASGNRRRRRWSGAKPDDRDPQPLGRLAARIAGERGWSAHLTNGQVFAKWAALVGDEVAEHARPTQLKDGELTVQADSTAWATQLRLLQRQLLARIAKGVGHGVVKRLKVAGPTAPSWRHGPLRVPGRGPRDTYG